ncbi:MAG TPA: ribonuclease D [Candidatus Limnocylindria bacterium]|nr:ribonuclease D [Candidatus Limnocylindria bacterium]
MADVPTLLSTTEELEAFATKARAAGRLAIDTEFVWERTYRPVLGVVQVATDDVALVLDAKALPSLAPLFPLLRDPDVPVVLHGGGQDLEIFAELMGEPVRGVFDTQVAAAFLGYGLQIGLSALLERLLKVRIAKDQTYTDWTKRPLKPEQLIYARQDVEYLLPVFDRLRAALEQRGRWEWVREEQRRLEDPERWAPVPDEKRYAWVKGWQRYSGRELAVLRALAAWRERTARRVNVRPNFITGDIVLLTLAGRPVETIEELRQVRGLSPGAVDRYGRAMLEALREGLACPREQWPKAPERVRREAAPSGLIALLRASVQAVAEEAEIAPEVIASGRDLEALVAAATSRRKTEAEHLPLVQGWRGELVGKRLLGLARGELAVRYDPRTRTVVSEPTSSG